jgi:hypothetical protein
LCQGQLSHKEETTSHRDPNLGLTHDSSRLA